MTVAQASRAQIPWARCDKLGKWVMTRLCQVVS